MTQGPSRTMSIRVQPCILSRVLDHQRWSWRVEVDGRATRDGSGYTLTKWGATMRARRFCRFTLHNKKRLNTPSTVTPYPSRKGSP